MPYILNTPAQTKEMLAEVGCRSFDELYSHLPDEIKIKGSFKLSSSLPEESLFKVIRDIARYNTAIDEFNSFLGAGIYDHYIPSPLKNILKRAEFYTAYTPYQPECSQGILQALYEYQSYICILTGMDATNASLYDGATSLAEAVLMALRIRPGRRVLVAEGVHPEYRGVLATYLEGLDIQPELIPFDKTGRIDLNYAKEKIEGETSVFVVQTPNFFGVVEDLKEVGELVSKKDIIFIVVTNPISLAVLRPPSEYGADIVCGDGQVLGGPMSFGGPSFGFLATREKYLRQLPGRIVGRTKDMYGRRCFCLTLQAREQHIRRQKATSNICSNESLNAISAAVYLSLMGKEGLRKVALYSLNSAHYLHRRLHEIDKVKFPFSGDFFYEFVWEIDNAARILKKLERKKILAGVPLKKFSPVYKNGILSACTEKKKKEDIDSFINSLKEVIYG